jgi:pimeloyl-ACP methyl ester carboxylesterase
MEVARFARPGDLTGRSLVVVLPGTHTQRRDFDSEGFIPALRQRFPLAEALALGLDLADYVEPDFPAQLHDGVIAPALRQGYAHISLVGISLGGMGALLYAAAYPDHAGNIILIAPFLATRRTIAVVTMAGGLAAWGPGADTPGDIERGLLAWLKSSGFAATIGPRLILGYGREDRFAGASTILARVMPSERLIAIAGGHNWTTWLRLWRRILDERSGELP